MLANSDEFWVIDRSTMNTRWINAGLFAGLLLSGGVVLAAPPAAQAGGTQYESSDQEFLEQALAVNQLELRLGELAAERATTPEVKEMGQKMVQKHTELGQQLAELARKSGGSGNAQLASDQSAILDRVASKSGSAFDTAFKQVVDAGHVKELAMYRDEVSRAASPQLRELAQGRVVKLQETVAQAGASKTKSKPKHDW